MNQILDKNKPLLTISIPTYNRSDYINYILEHYLFLNDYSVKIEIHDSSTDGLTFEVFKKFKEKINNIDYIKYEDIDVDIKTIKLLENCTTDYVFLCGDGTYLNEKGIQKVLDLITKNNIDVIEIYEEANKNHFSYYNKLTSKYKCKDIFYSDLYQHFCDNVWHTPYYGGTVIKSNVFKQINKDINKIIGLGFVYPFMIYTFNYSNFKSVVIGGDILTLNPLKKEGLWAKQGRHIEIWCNNFPKSIEKVYSASFCEKQKQAKMIIRKSLKRLNMVSFKNLLALKENNRFNFKIYKKFKANVNKYCPVPRIFIYIIFLVPNCFLRLLKSIKRSLTKGKNN